MSTRVFAGNPYQHQRPVVILLGWLGCQPRYLRRYAQTLYAGCDVISHIATPAHVIRATLSTPSPVAPLPPPTWPYSGHRNPPTTIEDLAWRILAELDARSAPSIFVHVFSNGGGLVWEALVRILDGIAVTSVPVHEAEASVGSPQRSFYPGPVRQRLRAIRMNLAGLVVDSAPSLDLAKLPLALQHVTSWNDRWHLVLQLPGLVGWWWHWNTPSVQVRLRQRSDSYRSVWQPVQAGGSIAALLPTIFLYSRMDPLASATFIEDILAQNRNATGKCFASSNHCAHFLKYTEEYTAVVTNFVQMQLARPDTGTNNCTGVVRSKL